MLAVLGVKLTDGDNTISLNYEPGEFQYSHQHTKDIEHVLSMGSKITPLYESLYRLNELLTTEHNIYDYLVAKGMTDVNPSLKLKKLGVSRLFNSISALKLEELTTLLSNIFIKESSFYDFSLGMLDIVNQNIKKGLDYDFVKINRRINKS